MNAVWSSADIHVHTTASDGHSSACEVLEAACEAGLAVVAITDHDTIDGALEACSYAERYAVEVIVGEEVSTRDGHLLALWIERHVAPGRPLAETIAEIHAQGGLAVIAHPFDWLVSSVGNWLPAQHSGAWPLDGVEVFNASLPLPGMNRRAAEAALVAGIAALGGSDSHHATTVGTGYTRFAGRTGSDLRTAILERRTSAHGQSWGPRATLSYLARSIRHDIQAALRPRVRSSLT